MEYECDTRDDWSPWNNSEEPEKNTGGAVYPRKNLS